MTPSVDSKKVVIVTLIQLCHSFSFIPNQNRLENCFAQNSFEPNFHSKQATNLIHLLCLIFGEIETLFITIGLSEQSAFHHLIKKNFCTSRIMKIFKFLNAKLKFSLLWQIYTRTFKVLKK